MINCNGWIVKNGQIRIGDQGVVDPGSPLGFQATVTAAAPEWYWKFDENDGLVAADAMGNQDLTLTENLNKLEWFAPGLTSDSSNAIRFANHIEYNTTIEASATTNQVGNLRPDFTIEFGVEFELINDPEEIWVAHQDDMAQYVVIYSNFGDAWDGFGMYLPQSSGPPIQLVAPLTTVNDNLKHWISIRCDFTGTQTLTLEIDGVQQATHTFTTEPADWNNTTTSPGMFFANDESGTIIDEFAIYHRAISNAERLDHATKFAT